MGLRDAGDPDSCSAPGDSPGSLGILDWGDPFRSHVRIMPPFLPANFSATEVYRDFKARVLERQIKNNVSAGKKFYPAVPDDDLEEVGRQGKKVYWLRKKAAAKFFALMAAAKADLEKEKKQAAAMSKEELDRAVADSKTKKQVFVADVKTFGISSAYRDFKTDEALWHGAIRKYYLQTYFTRFHLKGGEHGDAAVKYLAKYTSGRKAAPGFSNHSDGIAVDFWTTEGKELLQAGTGSDEKALHAINERWKRSWFHRWLVANKATHGFKPIPTEAWHWEFHG